MTTEKFSNSMNKLIDEVEAWMLAHDKKIATELAKLEKQDSCSVSCATCPEPACCHNKVQVYLADTLPIARRLMCEGRATEEFLHKLKFTGNQMEAATTGDWLTSYTPCMFLEDGRCTVYEQRPLQCRTYFVVSDPEICRPPPERETKFVNLSAVLIAWNDIARWIHAQMFYKETIGGQRPIETPGRILMAVLPRALSIMFEAIESDNYMRFVRSQQWPTQTQIDSGWREGKWFRKP
jgi:Fe-S-cluster containining protein